jgi:streptogramin lyase
MNWEKAIGMMLTSIALMSIAASAGAAEFKHLGQPCRAKNILATALVKDRATGNELFVLSDMNESTHGELLFIDFENDTGRSYRAPAGSGSWALSEVPGDRMIVGTFYDGVFMTFDLNKMEFIKVSDFPGETYIWNLALGNDGRVYGGTYPGGKLGALNLDDYTVEDIGAPAPPNLYCRYVWALPDGRILCYFNTEKPTSLIYDPKTKKFESAPPGISNGVFGTNFDGNFVTGRQVFDGKTLEEIKPIPFPTPPADKGIWSFARMTTPTTAYMTQGRALYSYTVGDEDIKLICDLDMHRGGIQQVTSKGWVLGLRGQDYFVIKPGDTKVELKPVPVESAPRLSMFLRVAPDGKLWGGPTFGQTLWWMNPDTKEYVSTNRICDAGGEVYDVAFFDDKVYAVSYARGDIVEYDPSQPWDQINRVNPKVIASLGSQGYIRPEGGTNLGPDGKLYTGWYTQYGKYGGAVSITDLKTGDNKVIENPLGEQVIISALPADDGMVYISSGLGGNGLPTKSGESPRFGVLDPKTEEVIFKKEFEGSTNVWALAYDAKSRRVLITVNGKMTLFDTIKHRFMTLVDSPSRYGRSYATAGDGIVFYPHNKNIIKLNMRNGRTSVVATAPEKINNVACSNDGKLYISAGVDVYAVTLDK